MLWYLGTTPLMAVARGRVNRWIKEEGEAVGSDGIHKIVYN